MQHSRTLLTRRRPSAARGLCQRPLSTTRPQELSTLQRSVAARIVEWARGQGLARHAALSEQSLAQQLGVSRTPVRAALGALAQSGLVVHEPGAGWRWRADARALARLDLSAPVGDAERLFVAIARDRLSGELPSVISEADLMRRYDVTRQTVLQVLGRLAEVGQVERKRGHGWAFLPAEYDEATAAESYAFRLLIEPAALLAPAFKLDVEWAQRMREQHEAMRARRWRDGLGVELFDLNAAFHEGLVAASGNRFLLHAIQQQNRLRRFVNVHWTYGAERVQVNCHEHLEILARLQSGEQEVASALLRRHLTHASRV